MLKYDPMGNERELAEAKQKRAEHMARRREHGLKFREIGEEFGTSKSSAHRRVKSHQQHDHEAND